LIWLLYFCSFVIPVILQGYLSWTNGFWTPGQMQERGTLVGLPFVAHTAMWSDATLFAALMSTIMVLYAPQWTFGQWMAALLVGFEASSAIHWSLYVRRSSFEQTHIRKGVLTPAGLIHVFYMGLGIAICLLFYMCTKNLSAVAVTLVSALLVIHVIIGTLIPLKVWASIKRPAWYPQELSFDVQTIAIIIGVAITVSIGSLWALRT
jgi:hypothetical protein